MNETLKVFDYDSIEYAILEAVANELNKRTDFKRNFFVKECYLDIDQNWMYTTIAESDSVFGYYQALTPKQQKILIEGNKKERDTVINEIVEKK